MCRRVARALSYSKAREITRVGNSGNEEYLCARIAVASRPKNFRASSASIRTAASASDMTTMAHSYSCAACPARRSRPISSRCAGFITEILDDGALRFVRPEGEPVDFVRPGSKQPPVDSGELPVGKFTDCWHGDRMDLDLAVDLVIQKSRRAANVPAGTSRILPR